MGVEPAGEPLLGGGEMTGRCKDEKEPRVGPGEPCSWVEAVPGEPTGRSGKGLTLDSGMAKWSAPSASGPLDDTAHEVPT